MADDATGIRDPLFGIYTLLCLSVTFLIMNALSTIPFFEQPMKQKQTEKRRNSAGVLLMLGASAIVFGFLDNYGMKLGTDALENGIFDKMGEYFMTPPSGMTGDPAAIENAKEKVGSMLGNTFSDFVGAMLGAGFGKLFEHLTSVSGDVKGDVGFVILQNPVMKVLLESIFIALGCLIPVFMEFHQERDKLYGAKGRHPVIISFLVAIGLLVGLLVVMAPTRIDDAAPGGIDEDTAAWTSNITSWAGVLVMVGLSLYLFRVFRQASMDNASDANSTNGRIPATIVRF